MRKEIFFTMFRGENTEGPILVSHKTKAFQDYSLQNKDIS
jgi:hypothetical protein